jgi:hypothetical protein
MVTENLDHHSAKRKAAIHMDSGLLSLCAILTVLFVYWGLFPGFIMFTIVACIAAISLFKWLDDESKAKKLQPNNAYNNKSEDIRFLDKEIIKELRL